MTDGLLVVDKPGGVTSHDVVARARRVLGTRKVGHAGTLDPMATGVLVLGVGRATRLLGYVAGADKDYLATIRLGQSTFTDDAEGEVVASASAAGVTHGAVLAAVADLTGELQQVPSTVSAIKVDGERAYRRAREGAAVDLPARPVLVRRFDVLQLSRPSSELLDVDVAVTCSTGTYVRALARDLGDGLGVGGHLTALRRTRVGRFALAGARTLDELSTEPDDVPLPVLALADAARATFPVREVTPDEARALGQGRRIPALAPPDGRDGADEGGAGEHVAGEPADAARHASTGTVAAIDPDGVLVALLEPAGENLRPVVVFAPA